MVAEIGLIIGCYVMTRMVDILSRPKERTNAFLMTAAALTLLLTAVLTLSLFTRGMSGGLPQ